MNYDPFGLKVIAFREPFDDNAIADRVILVLAAEDHAGATTRWRSTPNDRDAVETIRGAIARFVLNQ